MKNLAWGDPGFATAAYATALACAPLITGATEEQKEIWLRKVAEEGQLASYAVTEPGAGSDVAACKTTAVLDGDEYIINGERRCGLRVRDIRISFSFLQKPTLMLDIEECLVS